MGSEKVSKVSTKEYWEKEHAKSDNSFKHIRINDLFKSYWTQKHLKNLDKYVKGGKRVLDIGCGDGRYFIKLDDKFEEFHGMELSKTPLEHAKKIFSYGNYIIADANKLPFQDGYFDAIISFGAFEHNDNIDMIFEECYRVLDKSGTLLFSIPNYVSLWFPYVYILYSIIRKEDRISAIGHYYTKRQLTTKLQKAGFNKIDIVDSILAAPAPIVELSIGLVKKVGALVFGKSKIEQKMIEIGTADINEYGRLKENLNRLDYFFNKIFYPLELLGFGFMRVICCKK